MKTKVIAKVNRAGKNFVVRGQVQLDIWKDSKFNKKLDKYVDTGMVTKEIDAEVSLTDGRNWCRFWVNDAASLSEFHKFVDSLVAVRDAMHKAAGQVTKGSKS